MKKILLYFCFAIIQNYVFAGLQPGDEHWKQYTQIKGVYVTSCSNNGIVYACYELSRGSGQYIIYKITENDVIELTQIKIVGESMYSDPTIISCMTYFNNELIIAGHFSSINGNYSPGCSRWDGEYWKSLGVGIVGYVKGCISSDKEVFFYGDFSKAGGQPANSFVKWDGSKWTVLKDITCGKGQMVFSENFIYVVSECKESKSPGIVRYSIIENRWEIVSAFQSPSIGALKFHRISSLLITGKAIYVSGFIGATDGISILKFENDKWTLLGTLKIGGTWTVKSMAFYNNNLYIAGIFTGISDVVPFLYNIAKWDGSNWSALGGGLSGSGEAIFPINNSLIVLGDFTAAGGISSKCIAAWNESVTIDKPNSKSLFASAKAKVNAGDLTNALKDITQAINQNGRDPQLYNFRGSIYNSLLSNELDNDGTSWREYRDKAIADFNTAVLFNPEMVEAYINRGYIGYLFQKAYVSM